MDKEIITLLQIYENKFNKLYESFDNKNNVIESFNFGKINYLNPICTFVLPFIVFDVKNTNEKLEKYLPYIKDIYREHFLSEIKNFNKSDLQSYSDVSKEILELYNKEVNIYKKSSNDEKDKYIYDFCYTHELAIEKIAFYAPGMALGLIANLKTPKIQFNLIRNEIISSSIKKLILLKWIHEDWNIWLEDYFYYPRTASMEEFMEKWTFRNKVHIKHGKLLFDKHYETVKIWLKNKEKIREKMHKT